MPPAARTDRAAVGACVTLGPSRRADALPPASERQATVRVKLLPGRPLPTNGVEEETDDLGAGENLAVSTTDADRKRLWARSGNRCALCREELVRGDTDEFPGALVGQEAHIVAQSPGGPRYAPLEPAVRHSYDNLILLCANDHREVDTQPDRYGADHLRTLKRRHELWVQAMLSTPEPMSAAGDLVAVVMSTGTGMWEHMCGSLGYSCGLPDDLTDDEAELVDGALQSFVDWGEISEDVISQGFRAVREAKKALQSELDALSGASFAVLATDTKGSWAGGVVRGRVAVLQVVRKSELEERRLPF